MKHFPIFLALFIVACSQTGERSSYGSGDITGKFVDKPTLGFLKNLGPAPELTNEVWLNADKPLHLADLRGKIVLIDMWTFG